MSVTVRVDLNSAVVNYRPAAGEERSAVRETSLVAAWRGDMTQTSSLKRRFTS